MKKTGDDSGYLYNTKVSKALTNTGHDKDIIMDKVKYRLNWDADEKSVMAIIEYMKVL